MSKLTLLEARKVFGFSCQEVAEKAGCDRTTLYRVEIGKTQPRREVARALYRLYNGRVPLDMIYDAEFAAEIRAA